MKFLNVGVVIGLALILFGCAESDTQGNITRKTANTQTSTSMVTSTSDTSMCQNVCQPGTERCDGNKTSTCVIGGQGCGVWEVGEDCSLEAKKCELKEDKVACVAPPASCTDTKKNDQETDVDCGGDECAPCEEGRACALPKDCTTNRCEAGVCEKPLEEECKNEGSTQCGLMGIETCQQGKWVETMACPGGCKNLACVAQNDMCMDGQLQCDGNTPQTCVSQKWVDGQACPQGCAMGKCVQTVSCTASEKRCLGPIVQQCNASGSAWTFERLCQDRCDNGLCVGACTPDEVRCNGNQREVCQQDGVSWSISETCANGCDQGVCVENGYTNNGIKENREGVDVVTGCWTLEFGAEVTVPENTTLDVFADCIKITDSSKLIVGQGSTARLHAKTVEIDGELSGRDVVVKASNTLRFGGSAKTSRLWFWADKLTFDADADYRGGQQIWALYGDSFTNNKGVKVRTESVMPPFELDSSTHPSGLTWNWSGDDISLSWSRPFPGVAGYYVLVGEEVPDPNNAEFVTKESVALSADLFEEGKNTIHVVSVNASNEVGTYAQTFTIEINKQAPMVTSTSHPDSTMWNRVDDVFMSWEPRANLLPGSWIGYAWLWSNEGDAKVDLTTSMLSLDAQKLFPDQPQGERYFHLVALDRLGRVTPRAARYVVRIGAEPDTSNIAGSVKDAVTKEPIANAIVSLEGDTRLAKTGDAGDFTFRGEVYVRQAPYTIRVSAPGYESVSLDVTVPDTNSVVRMVELVPKMAGEAWYALGDDVELGADYFELAVGPKDQFVAQDRQGFYVFSTRHGLQAKESFNLLTDIQWIDGVIYGTKSFLRSPYSMVKFDTSLVNRGFYRSARPLFDLESVSDTDFIKTDRGFLTLIYGRDRCNSGRCDYELWTHGLSDTLSPFSDSTLVELRSQMVSRAEFKPQGLVWNDVAKEVVVFFSGNSGNLEVQRFDSSAKRLSSTELPIISYAARQGVQALFDGTHYHLYYEGNRGDMVLQKLDQRFQEVQTETLPGLLSVVFDGTSLLVVSEGKLEVRSPVDYSVKHTQMLPPYFIRPKLKFNRETRYGVLSYEKPNGNIGVRGVSPD